MVAGVAGVPGAVGRLAELRSRAGGGPGQLELIDGQSGAGMTLEDVREAHVAHRQRRTECLRRAASCR
jgi:hypothetical protein